MSDLDNGGLHSTVQSSAATTLTTMGDGDSAPTQSGMSAVIGDSTEDESGVPTVAMSEAQAEAMMAHLALGLDIHDEKYILGGQVRAPPQHSAAALWGHTQQKPRQFQTVMCAGQPVD